MPTVPVFITSSTAYGTTLSGPEEQWVYTAQRRLPVDVCKTYSGGIAWGGSSPYVPNFTGTVTISEPAAMYTSDWVVGEYTYSGDAIFLAETGYNHGVIERQAVSFNPLSRTQPNVQAGGAFAVTFDGDFADLAITDYYSWGSSTLNGVTVYDGLVKGQIRFNNSLTVEDFALTQTSSDTFFSGTVNGSEPLVIQRWHRSGSVRFAKNERNIDIRFGNSYGEWTAWQRLKFKPVGSFTAVVTEDEATLDASDIFVLGGDIREDNGFNYIAGVPPFATDEVIATQDMGGSGVQEGDALHIILQASSQAGCMTQFELDTTVLAAAQQFGSVIDATGVLLTAVNDGDNVQVSRFPTGAASRELLAVIPDARNPSLALNKGRDGRYVAFLSYSSRTDDSIQLVRSIDGGRTFA